MSGIKIRLDRFFKGGKNIVMKFWREYGTLLAHAVGGGGGGCDIVTRTCGGGGLFL